MGIVDDEEIFIGENSEIHFNGQPAGLILADTFALANSAASKVKLTYVENGKVFFFLFSGAVFIYPNLCSDSVYTLARSLLNPLLGVEAGKISSNLHMYHS